MKKEDKSFVKKAVRESMSSVKKFIIGSQVGKAVEEIKEEVEEAIDETKKRVGQIADFLTARMLSFYFIMLGFLMGFVGLVFFLIENTSLGVSNSLIIVGIILILLGWLYLKKR